jgi:hypothetical protein
MFSCVTVGCSEKDVKHSAHPENVALYCGICGLEMTEVE